MIQCNVCLMRLMGIVCLISGFTTACANYEYVAGEGRRVLPKHPQYHLKGQLQPGAMSRVLDPQAIYVFAYAFENSSTKYWYYRFWEDGQVLHRSRSASAFPTQAEADNMWGCDVGYYTLDGNTLRIELFTCCQSTWERGFYVMIDAEVIDGNVVEKASCERRLWKGACPPGWSGGQTRSCIRAAAGGTWPTTR
jgi:hypothetical protein